MVAAMVSAKKRMFLGVAQTTVGSPVCCGVGIVQCLLDLLYYVTWCLQPSATPRITTKDAEFIKELKQRRF